MHRAVHENRTGKRNPGLGDPARLPAPGAGLSSGGIRGGPARGGGSVLGALAPLAALRAARSNFPAFLRQAAEKAAEQPLSCK